MPLSGALPKPEGQAVTRHKPAHGWVDVPSIPYAGPVPVKLPATVHANTRRWWNTIRRMPHCVLWSDADWEFAIQTAAVVEQFHLYVDPRSAVELRQREAILGVTYESRLKLRIRYVDPPSAAPTVDGEGASVTRLADYRSL